MGRLSLPTTDEDKSVFVATLLLLALPKKGEKAMVDGVTASKRRRAEVV